MWLEEILGVLHGWLGLEIEVGTHGANGAQPVTALEVRGFLRAGEASAAPSGAESFLFILEDDAGRQVGSFCLYEASLAGGGWFDDEEEVLEIRSGVIQLLIAAVLNEDPPERAA